MIVLFLRIDGAATNHAHRSQRKLDRRETERASTIVLRSKRQVLVESTSINRGIQRDAIEFSNGYVNSLRLSNEESMRSVTRMQPVEESFLMRSYKEM